MEKIKILNSLKKSIKEKKIYDYFGVNNLDVCEIITRIKIEGREIDLQILTSFETDNYLEIGAYINEGNDHLVWSDEMIEIPSVVWKNPEVFGHFFTFQVARIKTQVARKLNNNTCKEVM